MQVRGVSQRLLKQSREPRLLGRDPLRAFNFVRIHQSLRGYTGDGGGSNKQLWPFMDMVRVIEDWEAARAPKREIGS
jgi:hypothetical protein